MQQRINVMRQKLKKNSIMNEQITLKGELTIRVFRNGELIQEDVEKNQIVNLARTSLTKLIAGEGSGFQVTKIGFGTNGTATTAEDTSLAGAYVKALGSNSLIAFNVVQFNWTLENDEANGLSIQELGLLSNNNTLFARRTRAAVNKTSDLRIEGSWRIFF